MPPSSWSCVNAPQRLDFYVRRILLVFLWTFALSSSNYQGICPINRYLLPSWCDLLPPTSSASHLRRKIEERYKLRGDLLHFAWITLWKRWVKMSGSEKRVDAELVREADSLRKFAFVGISLRFVFLWRFKRLMSWIEWLVLNSFESWK